MMDNKITPVINTPTYVNKAAQTEIDPLSMDAVIQIPKMMSELYLALSKLRDSSANYTQKQTDNHFQQILASYNAKMAATYKTRDADITSGALSIAGGIFAATGVGFGLSKVGKDIGITAGRTTNETLNGIGNTTQAIERQKGELEKLAGEVLGESAHIYLNNLTATKQLSEKCSAQMNDVNRELTQLLHKITGAVNKF